MTKQLKETLQEALTQLNERTGKFGDYSYEDYVANPMNALDTLLHGMLDYIEEKEKEDKKHFGMLRKLDRVHKEMLNLNTSVVHKDEEEGKIKNDITGNIIATGGVITKEPIPLNITINIENMNGKEEDVKILAKKIAESIQKEQKETTSLNTSSGITYVGDFEVGHAQQALTKTE